MFPQGSNRFYLREVVVHHFKSYGQKLQFNFTNSLNCVVGKNGCGKSALIDAICCSLGVDYRRLRVNKYSELITHLENQPADQCTVQLVFQNGNQSFTISFSIDSQENYTFVCQLCFISSFRFNGKQLSRERIRRAVVEQLGLPIFPAPLFVIQQNRVQSFCCNDSSFLIDFIHEVIFSSS